MDIASEPANPESVWLGTVDGLFHSTDGGVTWSLAHPVEDAARVTLVEAGANGTLYAFL